MSDFKDTLNLPKTTFPMRANLKVLELDILAQWERNSFTPGENSPCFSVCDGPPYANGSIHLGHAFNKGLKDIINRYYLSQGYQVNFYPGWDCYGLPIERAVEQTHGAESKRNVAFWLKECESYASHYAQLQQKEFERLGLIADWKRSYRTMDKNYTASVIRILSKIIAKKKLYRDFKPVHWCATCQSSLAEAELIYEEASCQSIYFLGDLVRNDALNHLEMNCTPYRVSLLAWTTTPWTISENQGFAVHRDLKYVRLFNPELGHFIFAGEHALPQLTEMLPGYEFKGTIKGSSLVGLTAQQPFDGQVVNVFHGDFVNEDDKSTGIVHISPSYGAEDFALIKKHNLPIVTRVQKDGCYAQDHDFFPGKSIFEVENLVIEFLRNSNKLVLADKSSHRKALCWRHKTPVFFLLTKQWFLNLNHENNSHIKDPREFQKRLTYFDSPNKHRSFRGSPIEAPEILLDTMRNRQEWCISRQRTWGIPLPIFVHKITGEMHPDSAKIANDIADIIEVEGLQGYYARGSFAELVSDSAYYYLVDDTLDVWFDAGCVPLIAPYHLSEHKPFDLVIEGRDQYRGWFQSMVLIASMLEIALPFEALIVHGYIVDGEGKKMSKSIGNIVAPRDIIDRYGADVLRIWIASSNYAQDINISEDVIKLCVNKYRKIRNTIRFLLAATEDYNHTTCPDYLLEIDKYILSRMIECQAQVKKHITVQDNLSKAFKEIYDFCVRDLSAFYINCVKDRQYTSPVKSNDYQAVQFTCYHLLVNLLCALMPIIPFTSQEALNHLHPNQHVLALRATNVVDMLHTELPNSFWPLLRRLIDESNTAFSQLHNENDGEKNKNTFALHITLGDELEESHNLLYNNDELHIAFGVASFTIEHGSETKYIFTKNKTLVKCKRCWQYFAELYAENICQSCTAQLEGQSCKPRKYF